MNIFELDSIKSNLPRLGENDRLVVCSYEWSQEEKIEGSILFEDLCVQVPPKMNDAVNKRKAEYVAGRYCAKRALKRLGYNHNGQILASQNRSPIWPDQIKGSISHTGEHAIALVSSDQTISGLGIDIENILSAKKAISIHTEVLLAEEIDNVPKDMSVEYFVSLMFSAKESFYKAVSNKCGRILHFHELKYKRNTKETIEFELMKRLAENLGFNTIQVGYQNLLKGLLTFCKVSK